MDLSCVSSFACGVAILCVTVPFVAPVVLCSVLWEAFDRRFDGGLVGSGKELSGWLMSKIVPWFNKKTHAFNSRFVRNEKDTFIINCIVVQGIIFPLACGLCFWSTIVSGYSPILCLCYHILRIGPYFMQFAYYYTLCHKEGHTYSGFYSAPLNNNLLARNIFNWWICLFFGVMPAAFAFGHSLNHHKYNNGPLDVVSTGDKPRDSLANFIAYVPRWTLYSLNISSIYQFLMEGNLAVAAKMMFGCVYWWGFFAMCAIKSPIFAVSYILYPFFENVVLLACINWSWHSFLHPGDPEDEFVGSVTILDGPINVLNEDFHVVHHQYPGCHWSEHPEKVRKHWPEYIEHQATCFRATHAFEIFVFVITRDYDALARKFVDLKCKKEEGEAKDNKGTIELLKSRLQACSWGPRVSPPKERSL
mmetsp:Transcript_5593/g.10505  ORF Transcript_5593/g.10505 Transcript_5593/m.10505 type:complete len:418 (+) Transcript_5593:60-1313(+)